MIRPYNKHQAVQDVDLRPRERLEPARAAVRHARQLLEQFERATNTAWDELTEEQLQTICDAAESAYNAAQNCAFLGHTDYNAQPVRMIAWKDWERTDKHTTEEEAQA